MHCLGGLFAVKDMVTNARRMSIKKAIVSLFHFTKILFIELKQSKKKDKNGFVSFSVDINYFKNGKH